MLSRGWFSLSVIAVLALADSTVLGQEKKPAISLLLSEASAERQEHDILFRCNAILDNATGCDLSVYTNFHSVFDGLELVVTTSAGKILAQQGYTYHQSPFDFGAQKFTLKQGRSKGNLIFPIRNLSADVKTLKVRLVGTLPKSDYRRILSSETLEIKVK